MTEEIERGFAVMAEDFYSEKNVGHISEEKTQKKVL